MRIVVFVFLAVIVSNAVGQFQYTTTPTSGTQFSLDLNEPGPTMTCAGYATISGIVYQQRTLWFVTEQGKNRTAITASNNTSFMLSNDTLQPSGTPATASLTVLNVTSNLDGATVDCFFLGVGGSGIVGVYMLKIYRPPVLKSVGTVMGLKNGSFTFQIGDTSSPPPYPQDTLSFTIAGSGSLSAAQIQYSHPNVTLSGLTEDNIGSYMLTATNRRLISNTIIGSSTGSFNLTVLFPPVITSGPSLVAAVLGHPATLVCGTNLRSNPLPSILWRNSKGTTLTTGGRYVFGNGSDNVYITISNTTTSDNGTWSCVVNNGVFTPLVVNIVLYIVVPPTEPYNVTSNGVSDNTTQLYISWQPPNSLGVPPVSVYMVTATSLLDPTNQIVRVNTTAALFTQLWPGLSYDITVVAISVFGGVSAVGPASNKETFNTEPNAPTVTCRDLIATSGSVNVSWTVVYNGGRDITAVQIAYTLGGTDQQYRPIQAVVTPTATSVIVREQFVSTRSYLFHISANNSVGISNIVTCGPVLIKEGIPVRPDEPQIISTKPGTITMTLSTAASGAGATGSFAFIISSVPSIDKMQSTYSYPEYIDGQKVSIVINNLRGDISYYFTVSARNVYGTSPPQSTIWLSNNTATVPVSSVPAGSSVAGPVAGGVIGGIIFVLVIVIIIVVLYLVLRQRGGTYEMANEKKGVKVEEIDVEFGEDTQPTTKQEIHYAELGSFKPKEPTQPKLTVAQKAAEEEPVTYSTVQINSAATPKEPTQEAGAAAKIDTSTTMV